MDDVALAWFRRDLRLADNPAWAAATAHPATVPIVVLEPNLLRAAGPHRLRAYCSAVAALEQSLSERGTALRVTIGDPAEVIPEIAAGVGSTTVVINADVTPHAAQRDQRVAATLGHPLQTHWGMLVHPPGSVLTAKRTLSQVFTPFWKRWKALPLPPEARASHRTESAVAMPRASRRGFRPANRVRQTTGLGSTAIGVAPTLTLADAVAELQRLGIELPSAAPADSDHSLRWVWSEAGATARLDAWLEHVDRYDEERDWFGASDTSRLSAALHFGLLSPRSVAATVGTGTAGRTAFVRQLAWRDWYAHLASEHPDISQKALKPAYDRITWRTGGGADRDFGAWKAGQTGYPIVDAAMRQLAATGWMHNRLRMIAASFLVKDLLIDWRRGERWFRWMLVDGDIAQNAGNWQWVAGTGPDAAPYFRVFNPVTQSRRYDQDGSYLRRWLPELAQLPDSAIHAPWEVQPHALAADGVRLGVDYPTPIVDHAHARQRTLAAYRTALDSAPR